uniref:Uncharacterized protein LOC113789280 n=1 Tax=Dermatophagoides pteronyssinus TaxID=6956 RepID=A0A6P6XME7_DERPT|nr:uncharacterized protein LOC113789280 [Dermatophagoides pteronyssinus]
MELDQVLRYENGQKLFMEFLRKEFSEENLEFWLECQRLKNISDVKLIKKLSREIYSKYISLNGSKTVNIDSNTLKMIRSNLNNPSNNIFDKAAKHVYELMENDSYQRFMQTTEYRNLQSSLTIENRSLSNRKRKSIPIYEPAEDSIHYRRTGPIFCDNNQLSRIKNSPILARRWSNHQFIKVIMPDGSYEFVSIIQQSIIGSVIENLLIKRSMQNYCFKIIAIGDNQEIEPTRNISSLVMTDIRIERVINFSICFPEGYMLCIETNPNKLAYYTIESILNRFGIFIHDVELTNEHGVKLCVDSLLKSSSFLDECVINVKYMSSLRTFLDLGDFNDLNQLIEDGIIIKSVKHKKYHDRKEKPFDFFAIDCCDQSRNVKKIEDDRYENIDNNQIKDIENVDLGNLSFSNETKTEAFLLNMMINDSNRFNFTCSSMKQNYYENIHVEQKENENDKREDSKNLHHAKFVYIDEPLYENDQIIRQEINRKNISKISKISDSPFTKYIQESPVKFSISQCPEYCSRTQSKNSTHLNKKKSLASIKPDLISITPKTRIRTLSKFHKFV